MDEWFVTRYDSTRHYGVVWYMQLISYSGKKAFVIVVYRDIQSCQSCTLNEFMLSVHFELRL